MLLPSPDSWAAGGAASRQGTSRRVPRVQVEAQAYSEHSRAHPLPLLGRQCPSPLRGLCRVRASPRRAQPAGQTTPLTCFLRRLTPAYPLPPPWAPAVRTPPWAGLVRPALSWLRLVRPRLVSLALTSAQPDHVALGARAPGSSQHAHSLQVDPAAAGICRGAQHTLPEE